MKRYDFCICTAEGCDCHMREDNTFGRYYLVADVEDLEQKYKTKMRAIKGFAEDIQDLLMVMEEQYIKRPDPEEVRKAVNKVKRLVKTQCKSFRRHGLTEEIAEAEKELLRLMGVQDGR